MRPELGPVQPLARHPPGEGDQCGPPHHLDVVVRAALVVAVQAPRARQPAQGSLHHPSSGQDRELPGAVGTLDHLHSHAVGRERVGQRLPLVGGVHPDGDRVVPNGLEGGPVA